MSAGVVPQQPPTALAPTASSASAPVPISLGDTCSFAEGAAVGLANTGSVVRARMNRTRSSIAAGGSVQLIPTPSALSSRKTPSIASGVNPSGVAYVPPSVALQVMDTMTGKLGAPSRTPRNAALASL